MLSKVFKVLGQVEDGEGAGVVGHNTATSGDAIGVEGKTESDHGYGLYTEDDAHIDGQTTTTSLSAGDPQRSVQAPHDSLREGYIVATAPGQQITVDPRTYGDAGAAMQDAADMLMTEMSPESLGRMWFSPRDPDGNNLQFSQGVTLGDTGDYTLIPKGWGFGGPSTAVDVTFTDGRLFDVPGYIDDDNGRKVQGAEIGGFCVNANYNQNVEIVRLRNISAFYVNNILLRNCGDHTTRDGAFVIEGKCFNSKLDNVGYTQRKDRNSTIFALRQGGSSLPPGEIRWGGGCSSFVNKGNALSHYIHNDCGADGIEIGAARFEGAGNAEAAILFSNAGTLKLNGTELATIDDQGNKVDTIRMTENTIEDHENEGAKPAFIMDSAVQFKGNPTGGAALSFPDGLAKGYIEVPFVGNYTGNIIEIGAEVAPAEDRKVAIPRGNRVPGPVDYPDPNPNGEAYDTLVYHDGYSPVHVEDGIEIPAGDEKVVSEFLREDELKIDVEIQEPTDGDGDIEIEVARVYAAGNQQSVVIRDAIGRNSSFVVDVNIERLRDFNRTEAF